MRSFVFGLAVVACGLVGVRGARAASISAPQTVVVSSGLKTQLRSYVYYKPDNFDPAKGMIIVLHGGGGTGLLAAGPASDGLFQKLADRVGVLVVFPDGIAGGWNSCSSSTNEAARPDDVAFIRALIPKMQKSVTAPGAGGAEVGADGSRVYVFGHSEGSKMAERLALEANDVVAAVGVMAGNLPVANDHTPDHTYKCQGYDRPWGGSLGGRAVPVFLFKGDMDPRIPFGRIDTTVDGHPDVAPDSNNVCQIKDKDPAACNSGLQHSYYETVAFWQWKLGLSTSKTDAVSPNGAGAGTDSLVDYADTTRMCPASYDDQSPGCGKVPSDKDKQPATADFQVADGSSVIHYTYGSAPYRLVFDRVRGGGHCFPGPSPQAPASGVPGNAVTGGCSFKDSGWKNRDTLVSNADPQPYVAEKLWTFFRQFSIAN